MCLFITPALEHYFLPRQILHRGPIRHYGIFSSQKFAQLFSRGFLLKRTANGRSGGGVAWKPWLEGIGIPSFDEYDTPLFPFTLFPGFTMKGRKLRTRRWPPTKQSHLPNWKYGPLRRKPRIFHQPWCRTRFRQQTDFSQ